MPWIDCFTCCCRLYLVYPSLCSSVVLLFGILWRTNEPLFPLPFKNDTTMKVLLLGRTLMFCASQGGFICVRRRVLEPVGEQPISYICKKMQENFNWGVSLRLLQVFKSKGIKFRINWQVEEIVLLLGIGDVSLVVICYMCYREKFCFKYLPVNIALNLKQKIQLPFYVEVWALSFLCTSCLRIPKMRKQQHCMFQME